MPKWVEVVDRVQVAHAKLLERFSCTAVVAYLEETKGVSRRTAQRTVQQAYALIREYIDKANVQRSDLVAQAIHLLMESSLGAWHRTILVRLSVQWPNWTSSVDCREKIKN